MFPDIDVSVVDLHCQTALHRAACGTYCERVIGLLCASQLNVFAEDDEGHTAREILRKRRLYVLGSASFWTPLGSMSKLCHAPQFLKTATHTHICSVTKCYRMLQYVTECYKIPQNFIQISLECHKNIPNLPCNSYVTQFD